MAIEVTIIGLGQIGGSIGLALGEHADKFQRTGHDLDILIARQARKIGAVDRVSANLISAIKKADIVILSLPIDQMQETLEYIAPDLREDAVVMDTGPVKEVLSTWAEDLLPERRHYVGLTPVINPAYLLGTGWGLEAAHADLFNKGMMAIVAPPRTASEAIKLAADLTRLLGAEPLFADPLEMDGLMAATHTLPQLISAALLNATIDQPGWREARKVAGRGYAEVTNPSVVLSEPATLAKSALYNRDNVIRSIDGVMATLQAIRHDIEDNDSESLESRLERARKGRMIWLKQRERADWASEGMSDVNVESGVGSRTIGRLFGFKPKKKPKDE